MKNWISYAVLSGRGRRATGGSKRRFVIGMVRHFLHIFGVTNFVVAVEHEDGATFDTQFFDQRAVAFPEGSIFMIGQHIYVIDLKIVAPTLLCERQIHT